MLFLHVGRGKAGSSTIQHFLSRHQAFLREHGAHPILDVAKRGARPLRAAHLFRGRRERVTDDDLETFRRGVGRAASCSVVASSEAFFETGRGGLDDLRTLIAETPVRVLIYVRDYANWMPSRYAHKVMMGRTVSDFDGYFREKLGQVSALPAIERWAETFGAANLSIRNLDPVDLAGGGLVHDLCDQLGTGQAPPPFGPVNVAPPAWLPELARALYMAVESDPEPVRGAARAEIRTLLQALRRCAATDGAPDRAARRFGSPEQLRHLSRLYDDDLAAIRKLTGCALRRPHARASGPLPRGEAMPRQARDAVRGRLPDGLTPRLRDLVLRHLAD